MKIINNNISICVIDWYADKLLDGTFNYALDIYTYLIDNNFPNINLVFFYNDTTNIEKLKENLKFLIQYRYGNYLYYEKNIIFHSYNEKIMFSSKIVLFNHAKMYFDTCKSLKENLIISNNSKILIGRRYSYEDFNKISYNNRGFIKENVFLIIPEYENYNLDLYQNIVKYTFSIYYKNHKNFKNPKKECCLININYSKYLQFRDFIDKNINDIDIDIFWASNMKDKRLTESPHYKFMTDKNVLDIYDHFTVYKYLEPYYQCNNCRLMLESLFLDKDFIYNRPTNIKDEAYYSYNSAKYDGDFKDIENSNTINFLENLM